VLAVVVAAVAWQALAQRRAAEQARADAERVAREAANQKADADAARLAAERARAEADAASRRLLDEKAAVEAARLDSLAEASRARAEAERARVAAEAMEREKADLRARLQQQLNLVLETHQSARGLIVNMSDVLFDFDRATLRPGAREKLAKVAGILLVYPDLQLEVEGHTDSVGTDDYNDRLSTLRAESVRDFLVREGISADSIMARGVGESRPVVSNDTAEGRQQNRRVELVVSGESIENVGTSSRR
jgi:outer membrane protein OmpA-like peptidoglycan-associated protein